MKERIKKMFMNDKEQNMNVENDNVAPEITDNTIQSEDIKAADQNSDDATNFEQKYKETYDQFLRLFAEFENYKRRTAKEKLEYAKTAGQEMVHAVLPALDDFERALKSFENASDVNALKEGVDLIFKKLKNALMDKGLEEMKTIGELFDADLHEAITQFPAPSEDMKGKIIDEAEKGYMLNGKVIRHPKVVVGN